MCIDLQHGDCNHQNSWSKREFVAMDTCMYCKLISEACLFFCKMRRTDCVKCIWMLACYGLTASYV